MKSLFLFVVLFTIHASADFFGGSPSKADLNKGLRIAGLIDETFEMKLIDFIEHGYPGAKLTWKDSAKNDYFLTIKYRDEMKSRTSLIKYHIKFGSNYAEVLEASADGQVIPPRMFPSVFVQMILGIGQETGNKKIGIKADPKQESPAPNVNPPVVSENQVSPPAQQKIKNNKPKENSAAIAAAKAHLAKEKQESDRVAKEKLESDQAAKDAAVINPMLGKHCAGDMTFELKRVDAKNLSINITGSKCKLVDQNLLIKTVYDNLGSIETEIKPGCDITINSRNKMPNGRIGMFLSESCNPEYLKSIGCERGIGTIPEPCD